MKKNKSLKFMIIFFSLICLLLVITKNFLLPVFKFEPVTGNYKIAVHSISLIDHTRKNKDNKNRRINVDIWYPSNENSSNKKFYISNHNEFTQAIKKKYKLPKFLFNYLKKVDTGAFIDSEFATDLEKTPVIFFSHGNMLGQNFTNTFQVRELVSHGYTVITIEHPDTAFLSAYGNGDFYTFTDFTKETKMEYTAQNEKSIPFIENQTEDILFVLDQLKHQNNFKFINHLDFNRIGIMGHSFGGATAINTMYESSDFKAGIDMDGYLYGPKRYTPLDKPMLIMNGEHEQKELKDPPEMKKAEQNRRKSVLGTTGKQVGLENAGHLSFTDIPLYSPMIETISPKVKENHKEINELTLQFFNRYLKGEENEIE